MKIIINEELKALLPPLTSDEYKTLEESIIENGCREPLIVWNDILIDGHNRFEICSKHNIDYQIKEIHAENIDEVKVWIIDNQKGRRNLTDGWKFELAQVKKEILLKQGREKQKETLGGFKHNPSVLSIIDKTEHNTRDEIASELGWSTGKVAIADKVWKEAKPEIKEKIKNGEVTFNQAYTDIKREKKKEQQNERFENLKAKEIQPITDNYDVIVIDPAWEMQKIEREVAPLQVGFDYPTMTIDEIKSFKLPAAENCHVFMWITHKYLPHGFEILKEWGVKYVCCFVWHKNGGFQPFGLPQYNCEFVLYGRIGTPEFFDLKNFNVCFSADRTRHSEKPELFYDTIRRVTAGKRIDIFNRRDIDGFDKWGNEA